VTARERRVLGIDFSGAADAGRKIWIAEGVRRGGRFHLLGLKQACELEGGGIAPEPAIAALARHIAQVPDTIAGCDFPFSLPRSLIRDRRWIDFIAAFPERFPDPDSFRAWALREAGGVELRRDADRIAKTPFNSYNLRIYRQTWWGIAKLLQPLLTAGAAVAAPYQPSPRRIRPVLVEACPAFALKSIGMYQPYKGSTDLHRRQRRVILRRLVDLGHLVAPEPSTVQRLIYDKGGDALDALIAALVAAATGKFVRGRRVSDDLEGQIYWSIIAQP
jgi:hypothetical protein